MKCLDAQDALGIIESLKNPEIHHYHQGLHPGSTWYIKTVLPDASMVDQSCLQLLQAWEDMERKHAPILRILPIALDWNGEPIPGWRTVWMDNDWDVTCKLECSRMALSLIEHDSGMRASAGQLAGLIDGKVSGHQRELLHEIIDILATYASKKHIKNKRASIRMVPR